jgi:hypothetical protein
MINGTHPRTPALRHQSCYRKAQCDCQIEGARASVVTGGGFAICQKGRKRRIHAEWALAVLLAMQFALAAAGLRQLVNLQQCSNRETTLFEHAALFS